jgi:hypothetical protein
MTAWKTCATPPERDGWFEVERRFKDGSLLEEAEQIRYEDEWKVVRGSEILEHDVWREIGGME